MSWSTCDRSSPLEWPCFGGPVNWVDVKPLKRVTTVGALRKAVDVSAETGTIWLFVPRTYNRPTSLGDWRYSWAAFACTRYVLPNRLKSLMYSEERNACSVANRS